MYYMKSALAVPSDTMYISDLDLNIENARLLFHMNR